MERNDRYLMLKNICQSRRSTRVFSDQPVPEDIIEKIKAVAYTSPYASGKKNWEITLISKKEVLIEIANIVDKKIKEIKETIRPDLSDDFLAYAKNFTAFTSAPIVFVLTFRISKSLSLLLPNSSEEIVCWERDNFMKSISCVAMLIILAAESLGLGSCYMTGPLIAEQEIGNLIKIKKGRNIGAVIPVGYKQGDKQWI